MGIEKTEKTEEVEEGVNVPLAWEKNCYQY